VYSFAIKSDARLVCINSVTSDSRFEAQATTLYSLGNCFGHFLQALDAVIARQLEQGRQGDANPG